MGLFDGSKKGNDNTPLSETISILSKQILPGGQDELIKVLDDLEGLTDHNCPRDILVRIFLYQSTLFTISKDKSKSRIVGGTMRHKGFTVGSRVANAIYDYVLRRFAIKNYGVADEPLLKMLNASFGNVELRCTGDVIYGSSGPYGRCASNPIPVRGIPMQEEYLSHLRTLSKEKVTWKRLGSGHSDVTEYPIDMYLTYDPSGNDVGKVYVSGYQAITSKTAPEGFLYAENNEPKNNADEFYVGDEFYVTSWRSGNIEFHGKKYYIITQIEGDRITIESAPDESRELSRSDFLGLINCGLFKRD